MGNFSDQVWGVSAGRHQSWNQKTLYSRRSGSLSALIRSATRSVASERQAVSRVRAMP